MLYWISLAVASWIGVCFCVENVITQYQRAPQAFLLLVSAIFYATMWYILPNKFGFDKRRLHLSSLIWSGQVSRDDALAEMAKPDYPKELQEQDRRLAEEKLGISHEEFEKIMSASAKSFWDYPSYKKIFKNKLILFVYHALKRR